MPESIEISFKTIVKTIFFITALLFILWVKELVIVLIISFIIASAYAPLVEKLKEKKVPRVLSALLLYLATLIFLSFLIYLIIQPLSQEFSQISKNIPQIINQFTSSSFFKEYGFELREILLNLSAKLQSLSLNAINLLIAILGGFLQTAVVLVLSFYLTIENKEIQNFISLIFPRKYQAFFFKVWNRSQKKLGSWLKAQLFLMMLVGTLSFIGLNLLGIPFALSLAILSGLFEIIPYAGPIFAAIVAIFIALIYTGPFYAILTLILYFLIQQLENYVIVPKIMEHTFRLSPILIISAIYVGTKLVGAVGGLLAIPITVLISETIKEYQELKDAQNNS